MLAKKSSPLRLDAYGTRRNRQSKLNAPDIVYARKWFGYLCTLAFIAIDSVCLYSSWDTVQTQNPIMIYMITVGCSIVLDFPLALAGYKFKNYKQGLESRESTMLTLILSITTFTIALVFNFIFRVITRDLVFDTGSASMMTNAVADTVQTNDSSSKTILFAAIFNGVIPLCTSIASFVITFVTTDSLHERIYKLQNSKIAAEANRLDLEVLIKEAEDVKQHMEFLKARENDMYFSFTDEVNKQATVLKQLARLIIMEKLATPDAISCLEKSGKEVNQKADVSISPYGALVEHLNKCN